MGSTGVVEEPISSELALVDGALARRARAALPDRPWLLPVLAELQEDARTREARAPATPPLRPAADRPTARRRWRVASILSVLLVLAGIAVAALAFFPLSRGPTLETTAHEAAPTTPARPRAVAPARQRAAAPTSGHSSQHAAKAKVVTHAHRAAPARTRHARAAARPSRPRVGVKHRRLTRTQREVSWRRRPAAAFYELHLQRGADTVYETRTTTASVVLPAGLALRPGRYQMIIRPAIPNSAGITLGEPVLRRTLTV